MASRIVKSIEEAATDATIFAAVTLALKKFVIGAGEKAAEAAGPIAQKKFDRYRQEKVRRQLFFDLQAIPFEKEKNLLFLFKKANEDCKENDLVLVLGQIYSEPPEEGECESCCLILIELNKQLPTVSPTDIVECEKGGILIETLNNNGVEQDFERAWHALKKFGRKVRDEGLPEVTDASKSAGDNIASWLAGIRRGR